MNKLEEYFYTHRKNIVHKWTHYFEIYDTHFNRYIDKECVILEIGVAMGGSLQMWRHYFGNKAKIFGIDININCKNFKEENIEIFIGSQSDKQFLRDIKLKIPKIDILIDDGGHTMDQQKTCLEEFFDHINDDGIYLCEDTHTSYWPEFGGGLNKKDSFIELTKTLIDKLNAWHIRNGELHPDQYTRLVGSLHFYDSIFVLEKKKRLPPWHERRGIRNNKYVKQIKQPNIDLFALKLELLGIPVPDREEIEAESMGSTIVETMYPDLFEGKIWPQFGETMIGFKRLSNIEFCINETIKNNIAGDLIETGIWRGGACIFMRAVLSSHGIIDKKVWAADSFEGLPKPNASEYPDDYGDPHFSYKELAVSLDEVKDNFQKYLLLDDQVIFLQGWFKNTLPTAPIESLSILRLDGDMYESTIDALFYLYPKLSVGGYCITDDWGAIPSCKKAVEDYRRVYNITENMEMIDWTGVYWKKERNIPFDLRYHFNLMLSNKIP